MVTEPVVEIVAKRIAFLKARVAWFNVAVWVLCSVLARGKPGGTITIRVADQFMRHILKVTAGRRIS
jgi:hypothetical protein